MTSATHLVPIGLVGKHPILCRANERQLPRELIVQDLGVSVNADGANGLTVASPLLARQLGVQSPDGGPIKLAAYHPDDWGLRTDWVPYGRLAYGLDAPEAGAEREQIGTDSQAEPVYHYSRAYGLLLDATGQPHIQGPADPYPGAYLSPTALVDPRHRETDARRYFDSASLPGFVLPHHDLAKWGVRLGDIAWVIYNGVGIWAQAYDSGNSGHLVELSIAACLALGIDGCARNGGVSSDVDIHIYPGSGVQLHYLPGTAAEISEAGERVLAALRGD